MELPITVREQDIFDIADGMSTTKDGMVLVSFNEDQFRLKRIMLRSVLKCFGEQYHIVSEEDEVVELTDGTELVYINVLTNLPFSIADQYWGLDIY